MQRRQEVVAGPHLVLHGGGDPRERRDRLLGGSTPDRPAGVLRIDRATYDDQARAQVATAAQGQTDPRAALAGLIGGGDTWIVV